MSVVQVWSQVLHHKKEGAPQMHNVLMEIILWWGYWGSWQMCWTWMSQILPQPLASQKNALGKELRIDAEWEAMQDK